MLQTIQQTYTLNKTALTYNVLHYLLDLPPVSKCRIQTADSKMQMSGAENSLFLVLLKMAL
jgi:hypothetical protein